VLSGRVENVALMHAVGATVGLSAGDSLLVFSTTAALSAAIAAEFDGTDDLDQDQDVMDRGGRQGRVRQARSTSRVRRHSGSDAEVDMVVAVAKGKGKGKTKGKRKGKGKGGSEISAAELEAAKEKRKVTERRQKAAFYRMERRLQDILTREFARFRFRTAVDGLKSAANRVIELVSRAEE